VLVTTGPAVQCGRDEWHALYVTKGVSTVGFIDSSDQSNASSVLRVPVASLSEADSPRLAGKDQGHIDALVQLDVELPPITVHRQSMRVIDGMHRLAAAISRGDKEIAVRYYDGDDREAFVLAVEANLKHGLPLSLADRTAAAVRIMMSYPHWSDRAIADATGLAWKTVASIRKRSTTEVPQLNVRVGRDGRVRPLDCAEGRLLASKFIAESPDSSLRQIARAAGISIGTARDVRQRLNRGEDPAPSRTRSMSQRSKSAGQAATVAGSDSTPPVSPTRVAEILDGLRNDPSIRLTQSGRQLLRHLDPPSLLRPEVLSNLTAGVPPYSLSMLAELARAYAERWRIFSNELERRRKAVEGA
jgi:ParB-like chromosome segregation protein Spo0J